MTLLFSFDLRDPLVLESPWSRLLNPCPTSPFSVPTATLEFKQPSLFPGLLTSCLSLPIHCRWIQRCWFQYCVVAMVSFEILLERLSSHTLTPFLGGPHSRCRLGWALQWRMESPNSWASAQSFQPGHFIKFAYIQTRWMCQTATAAMWWKWESWTKSASRWILQGVKGENSCHRNRESQNIPVLRPYYVANEGSDKNDFFARYALKLILGTQVFAS